MRKKKKKKTKIEKQGKKTYNSSSSIYLSCHFTFHENLSIVFTLTVIVYCLTKLIYNKNYVTNKNCK